MPNIRSAAKRVRQTRTRTSRNRVLKSKIKAASRGVRDAVAKGDAKAAEESFKALATAADTAAKKGTIHKNAAGRIKSRAAKAMAAGSK